MEKRKGCCGKRAAGVKGAAERKQAARRNGKNRRRQAEYREREPSLQAAANQAAGGNGEIRYKQKYNCGPAK